MRRSLSTFAVAWAILKMGARRKLNGTLLQLRMRRSRHKDGQRRATPPRRSAWGLVAGVFYAAILMMGILAASRFLDSLSGPVCNPGQIRMSRGTYSQLQEYERRLHGPGQTASPDEPGLVPLARRLGIDLDAVRAAMPDKPRPQEADATGLPREVASALRMEARLQALRQPNDAQIENRLVEHYRHRGLEGFYPRDHMLVSWPGRDIWPNRQGQPAILAVLSATLSVMAVLLVVFGFSQYGRNLPAAHWSMEWFFTFPARARAIFLADVLQGSLLNVMAWMTVFPLMLVVLGSCGYGLAAPLPAAICTLYLSALAGSVCMLGETWMRRHFTPRRLRSVQATCTLLGTVGLVGLMISAFNPFIMDRISAFAARAANWPPWLVLLPAGAPLLLTISPVWAAAGASGMIALAALAAMAATRLSERLVRTGLVVQAGMPAGRRAAAQARPARTPLLRGVLGREVRLLLRDRNLLANTVIMPMVVGIMQVFLQHRLVASAWGDLRHTAAAAFGIGCYVVLVGGIQVLASEGRSLWMLYTFPRGLEWVLLRKVAIWACLAVLFAAGILAYGLSSAGQLSPGAAFSCFIALWGVGVFAFIDCGIGIMSCRLPQGPEKAKVRLGAVYLCMILAGLYGAALYANSPWNQLVWAVLFAMVAAAIWQLVRDRIGYLLDTTAKPPPALSVAHGLVVAFAFFAVHGLLLAPLLLADIAMPAALSVSYAAAGLLVGATALLMLRNVPNLLRLVGLAADPARTNSSRSALLTGLGLGVLAGAVGAAYLLICRQVPWLYKLSRESSNLLPMGTNPLALVGLVLLAAPAVEEFIFRGLLFRGLERMGRPALAILGSAAIFAVIHPPVSIAPVFVLGLAAAAGFRKTGLLLTPIATHATYNGLVLLAGYWLLGT